MRIAVIGTGNVGSALGKRWAEAGHAVIFGTREPEAEKVKGLLSDIGENACADLPAEAAGAAEAIVLATPWGVTQQVVETLGDLTDKVIIDATNPIAPGLELALGTTTSGAEEIAKWADGAAVVKAFNTTGYNNMLNPDYDGQSATMFIAGDNEAAKEVVTTLSEEIGFDVADVGVLKCARYLEPMAFAWITMAMVQGMGRDIAFKLLKR